MDGIFITFEGGDGAGKTTHMRFLASCLREQGYDVVCLREPGGTIIGERLRNVVLDPGNEEMVDQCELLIYEAARSQLVSQVLLPALQKGSIVLCDRYVDSTVAYQAYGRNMDLSFVQAANEFATGHVIPDRTILMVTGATAEVGLERASHRAGADRLELAGVQFHERVNEGYLAIAKENPDRIRVVVSDASKADTAQFIFSELSDLFPWMADPHICDTTFFDRANTSPEEWEGLSK